MAHRSSVAALVLLLLLTTLPAFSQRPDPLQWSLAADAEAAPPGSTVTLRLTGTLEPGWHLYSATTPPGPIATTIELAENPAVKSFKLYQPQPVRKFDQFFNSETETFEKEVTYILAVELTEEAAAGPVALAAQVRYAVCDDRQCLPPRRKTAEAVVRIDPAAPAHTVVIPAGYFEVDRDNPSASTPPAPAATGSDSGLARFLLIAFGFGLAAIFTPCVFPMIPITMSFFLDRKAGSRADSIFQASIFCIGIVVLFTLLGVAITAILGPFGVVQMGANPWVNGFISLVFFTFALSLLGAFEIALPAGMLTKLSSASQKGGIFGTMLMGLTFSLTSFACVGPFVGPLLAASVQGGGVQPVLGMVSFAGGLASPFFFLALFPSYLQRLPRSGGWMVRVKVVMGFILLAVMLKYISNIDQVMQWDLLNRERFLAAWVVLFALPGLYLLGFLRMDGIKAEESVGPARALTGAIFLIFAISLIPGMFGGRLGELDAYVPLPKEGSGFAGFGGSDSGGRAWMKNRYREALDTAREQNKLVFISFTGYACTNCHWMKANMFTRPEIRDALGNFVLVELYTDGTDADSEANQSLQETKFATVAIPYYAIVDPNETTVATFAGLTKNSQEFLQFLSNGTPTGGAGN